MRRHPFWYILILTAIVWLGRAMSEHEDYPMEVRVQWDGIDTAHYVVTHADTVLNFHLNSTCFQAIRCYFATRRAPYRIGTQTDTTITIGKPTFDDLAHQMQLPFALNAYSATEALRLTVNQREGRAYVPKLRDISFRFDDQVGLAGNPTIEPDTVWLYGSPASLDKIDELYTSPAVIEHIADSGHYALPLEPVWKAYPDLRISHEVVRIFLPVERFAEAKVKVPVRFRTASQLKNVRLYPEQVEVTLWVPSKEYKEIDPAQLEAVADYDAATGDQLPVLITRFPANTRIKQITPATIQYVIIK